MLFADHCSCGGRSQAHDDLGLDPCELSFQPWAACGDFGVCRLLVNAPLAALFEFKMFDGVRNVHIRTVNARVFERAVQQTAGRSDKWFPGKILFVAGLLAHHDDAGARGPSTENRLRRVTVEIARFAFLDKIAQLLERRTRWNKQLSTGVLLRGGHLCTLHLPYSRRNSVFACLSKRLRSAGRFLPARLI